MTVYDMLKDIKSGRRKKVILDTDTYNEIDDQYALAYCYFADSIDLLSVNAAPFYNDNSSGFEDGMLKSYDEINRVLGLCDKSFKTPVFKGSATTVKLSGDAVESPAAQNIIDTVKASDEPVYVLAIGAVTNVASALMTDPSVKDNMCVIWLGANQIGGKISSYKTLEDYRRDNNLYEFNLEQDYAAGQILLNSGVPLLLCPAWCIVSVLTTDVHWNGMLRGANDICNYLYEITEERHRSSGGGDAWVRTIWDIAAPAIIDNPDCAEIEIIPTPVLTDDKIYAYDSTRHKMLYLKKIDRQSVYERTWSVLKNGK